MNIHACRSACCAVDAYQMWGSNYIITVTTTTIIAIITMTTLPSLSSS